MIRKFKILKPVGNKKLDELVNLVCKLHKGEYRPIDNFWGRRFSDSKIDSCMVDITESFDDKSSGDKKPKDNKKNKEANKKNKEVKKKNKEAKKNT